MPLVRDRGRDAVVDGVDDAADRLRAVAQRGRARAPPRPDRRPADRWARRDRRSAPTRRRSPRPFSWMRTRKPLRPRITGRLAPGANVVAAIPGRAASASPSVGRRLARAVGRGVTTVTATKPWSGDICRPVPARSGAGALAEVRRPVPGPRARRWRHRARRRHGDAGKLRLGVGRRRWRRRSHRSSRAAQRCASSPPNGIELRPLRDSPECNSITLPNAPGRRPTRLRVRVNGEFPFGACLLCYSITVLVAAPDDSRAMQQAAHASDCTRRPGGMRRAAASASTEAPALVGLRASAPRPADRADRWLWPAALGVALMAHAAVLYALTREPDDVHGRRRRAADRRHQRDHRQLQRARIARAGAAAAGPCSRRGLGRKHRRRSRERRRGCHASSTRKRRSSRRRRKRSPRKSRSARPTPSSRCRRRCSTKRSRRAPPRQPAATPRAATRPATRRPARRRLQAPAPCASTPATWRRRWPRPSPRAGAGSARCGSSS